MFVIIVFDSISRIGRLLDSEIRTQEEADKLITHFQKDDVWKLVCLTTAPAEEWEYELCLKGHSSIYEKLTQNQ